MFFKSLFVWHKLHCNNNGNWYCNDLFINLFIWSNALHRCSVSLTLRFVNIKTTSFDEQLFCEWRLRTHCSRVFDAFAAHNYITRTIEHTLSVYRTHRAILCSSHSIRFDFNLFCFSVFLVRPIRVYYCAHARTRSPSQWQIYFTS